MINITYGDAMFDIPSLCIKLERDLQKAGLHIEDVLRQAGVDRSSWTGWKRRGVSPRIDTWLRAEGSIKAAIEEAKRVRKKGRAA